ncbi:HD domain-containing protein [Desulfonatronum thiodismutans]|uniref:HD domain-containing protein n=1 Tax=Desulfonatronum thiodismutans TaxID=159290 RepID=UPI00068FB76F|nr:HD domain-containing protein [Desulfonatronum thiodismutans]
MTGMDMEAPVLALVGFAREHFSPDAQDRANMALKLDHCLRVFQEAETITIREGLQPDATRRSLWAALFHDVGRFPQYATHKTFDDRKSTDHGSLGVRTLKRRGLLAALDEHDRKAVLAAVILHNKRFLPPDLPDWAAVPARVVRDADKLDIFQVMIEHLRPGARNNPVVTLGLHDEPAVCTDALVEQILAGKLGDYARMRTLNDFRLLLCSWVYDLNFPASRQAVEERGHLNELLDDLPDLQKIRRVRETVLSALERK